MLRQEDVLIDSETLLDDCTNCMLSEKGETRRPASQERTCLLGVSLIVLDSLLLRRQAFSVKKYGYSPETHPMPRLVGRGALLMRARLSSLWDRSVGLLANKWCVVPEQGACDRLMGLGWEYPVPAVILNCLH